jgi:hypothetical protein
VKIRALLLALALATAALPASAAGPIDTVTGAGTVLPTNAGSALQFSLQAKSDADGSHARATSTTGASMVASPPRTTGSG